MMVGSGFDGVAQRRWSHMQDDLTDEEIRALHELWIQTSESGGFNAEALVVDDDPAMLEELQDLIESEHVTCHVATGAEEAYAQLQRHPGIRIVVTDLCMPGADGLTMIRHIKERHPESMRYMMISAHGTMRGVQDAMHEDVLEFLTKPLDDKQFLSRFRRVMWMTARDER